MNNARLARRTSIHSVLILSVLMSFFLYPAPAQAGILSKVLSTLRPALSIAGRIGGAVVGASMASAIVPPLGLIAGGIAGWIAGGVLTDMANSSLPNLAFVGTGIVGAMALGPGALGIVGGFLIGGILGKIAMGLIMKADRQVTGGVLLSPAEPVTIVNTGTDASNTTVTTTQSSGNDVPASYSPVSTSENLQQAETKYQQAYQNYVELTRKNVSAEVIKTAQEMYKRAYEEFQAIKNMR